MTGSTLPVGRLVFPQSDPVWTTTTWEQPPTCCNLRSLLHHKLMVHVQVDISLLCFKVTLWANREILHRVDGLLLHKI